jgi:hypothetical protein
MRTLSDQPFSKLCATAKIDIGTVTLHHYNGQPDPQQKIDDADAHRLAKNEGKIFFGQLA